MPSQSKESGYYPVVMHVLAEAFAGVDTRLRQRHWLDGHLPFGLRKGDAELEPMKDRWTDRDRVPMERFAFWATHALETYLRQGIGMLDRLKYGRAVASVAEDVTRILHLAHASTPPDPSGIRYVTCAEIRAALVLVALNFINQQWQQSAIPRDTFKESIAAWRRLLEEVEEEEAGRLGLANLDQAQGCRTLKEMLFDIRRFGAGLA